MENKQNHQTSDQNGAVNENEPNCRKNAFMDNLKNQLTHPVSEIGVGYMIFYGFVLVYVIAKLLC